MRLIDRSDSPQDVAAAVVCSALLVLSAASAAAVLRVRRLCRRRLHDIVNPLWSVRLVLLLFASIWSLSDILRSPIFRRRLPLPFRRRLDILCHAHLVATQALAEPAFLTVVLFLLRASIRPKPASSASAFAAAIAAALVSALPFLTLYSLYLTVSTWDLRRLSLPPVLFGPSDGGVTSISSSAAAAYQCTYPLIGAVLLAVLGAVYVPVFISASWGAVSVVINRRLRARLYALSATVVGALSVQVAALTFSTLCNPGDTAFQWLSLAAAVAFATLAAVGEAILVVWPIIDALSVGKTEEATPKHMQSTCVVGVRDVAQEEGEVDGGWSDR
ncbi:uncharacterized protein LOC135648338 [Musa acuminata AAA Group]|uniref:(wild Malaysian banana) hypothetical protein n=1 Tax=Musa acuminata subsp. malaccensis TaxID=214687 RepID=A0A804KIM6_MUSAM|nr:PREDICTED: uncharacterized protein LOC103997817 [Musa acuminata subsp. malaccensis]CAG1834929.1 unnamed protein product [Musa acuminata subsp. malaccensis]